MKIKTLSTIILVALSISSCQIQQKKTIFTIGSGSKNAMYYPVATALCQVFNQYNDDKSLVCEAKLSKGAEFNLNSVENGHFDMGISQAYLQGDAYLGRGKFVNNPHKNLRTLFAVHNEYLTIIARKDAAIKSFSDLRFKKVNIGNQGSGSRILFSQMVKKLGWKMSDFKKIYQKSGSHINEILCATGKADAAVYIVGHPNESFRAMIDDCNLELVSLSGNEIKKFISISPTEFFKNSLSKKTYQNSPKELKTFASKTILTTSKNLDAKIVKKFVKILSEHKKDLIKKQPSLMTIKFYKENEVNLAPVY